MGFGAAQGSGGGGSGVSWSAYTQTYSTADATHAARVSSSLTDNSGGTPSTTLQDVTDSVNTGSADRVPVENALASLAAQVNNLITDQQDTAAIVNQLIDDTQA